MGRGIKAHRLRYRIKHNKILQLTPYLGMNEFVLVVQGTGILADENTLCRLAHSTEHSHLSTLLQQQGHHISWHYNE